MNKISRALAVSPSELIEATPVVADIVMGGLVTDRHGTIQLQRNDPSWTSSQQVKIDLGTLQGDRDIWVTVGTHALYPLVHSGDFIRFTYLSDLAGIEPLLNRLCLVHVLKKQEVLIGFLRWIGKERVFDLDVPGSTPVRNVQVDDIAAATIIVGHPLLV